MQALTPLLDVYKRDDSTIVRFGEMHLDPVTCDDVFRDLIHLAESGQPKVLILNFRQVKYFHSVCIGWLIALHTKTASLNGELRLCGFSPQAIETLTITRVERMLQISDTERAALAVVA